MASCTKKCRTNIKLTTNIKIMFFWKEYDAGLVLVLQHAPVTLDRNGEIRKKPPKTEQASILEASTFTKMTQQYHHDSFSQHFRHAPSAA